MRPPVLIVLALAGGLLLWQAAGGSASTSIGAAASCVAGKPGYSAERMRSGSGAEQLLVTTPGGAKEGSVFLTIFESEDDAQRWERALDDFTAGSYGPEDERLGTVYADWVAKVPPAEREAVLGCL